MVDRAYQDPLVRDAYLQPQNQSGYHIAGCIEVREAQKTLFFQQFHNAPAAAMFTVYLLLKAGY